MDTEPVITFLMDLPSGFAPEPDPLPFATYRVRPSGETASAVGYHPTGMSPATRMCRASSRTTATALFPAIATNSVLPSGEIDPRDAVRARQRHEEVMTTERQGGRMGTDEDGPADRRAGRQVDHAHRRVAPVTHVEVR